ncbi:galactokinase like protein [Gigaspora margarita]|uniref:Galactokinase like protein n=1 Tax=Gigaspora margarita TaxID=4874 RepID=A0A8H4EJF6_GIGMA|nr:galactokinase like protein [Gigaspora margarita]
MPNKKNFSKVSTSRQRVSTKSRSSYVFCYYVSGHGFGHATRVVQVASEILALPRLHTLYIVSNAPEFIFQGAISLGARYRHALIDAGVQQPRAYTVDRYQTIDDLELFLKNRPDMIVREVEWLKKIKADIVLSDAPFLPCAAAASAGIPSAIVSNFTFDAVYSGLCEGDELDITIKNLVEKVKDDYMKSELLIRLPGYIPIPSYSGTQLYPDSNVTTKKINLLNGRITLNGSSIGSDRISKRRNVVDVPLVVRKSKTPRNVVLSNLGIPKEIFDTHKILLVSFGGQNLVGIEEWGSPLPDDWIAIVCGNPGAVLPDRFYSCAKDAYIPDLTNAADAVMGKLGYGTCSECIGHGKPFIYVPRPQFIEEYGLRNLMETQGSCVEMSKDHFESGQWKEYILKACDMPGVCQNIEKRLSHDGGKVVANIVEQFLDERLGTTRKTRKARRTNALVYNNNRAVSQPS